MVRGADNEGSPRDTARRWPARRSVIITSLRSSICLPGRTRSSGVVVIAAIVAAEVAFWMLLLGGLALRYLARARRLSSAVLATVPLVDR